MYEQMFSAVYLAKEGTRSLSEMFKLLPSKKIYEDYYKVIKKPMDLKTIAIKVQQRAYTGLDEMVKDLMLIITNAKTYNEPQSRVYKVCFFLIIGDLQLLYRTFKLHPVFTTIIGIIMIPFRIL